LAEEQRQRELELEQRERERLQRERRKAIEKQAEAWLKELDPVSGEGLWFERFAMNYKSRLEAAIDYLAVADNPIDSD
jgi:CRISPR/Cas system-associated endonuclease Cas3-HD